MNICLLVVDLFIKEKKKHSNNITQNEDNMLDKTNFKGLFNLGENKMFF